LPVAWLLVPLQLTRIGHDQELAISS